MYYVVGVFDDGAYYGQAVPPVVVACETEEEVAKTKEMLGKRSPEEFSNPDNQYNELLVFSGVLLESIDRYGTPLDILTFPTLVQKWEKQETKKR